MVDLEKVEEATRLLLEGIGEDPARGGLVETPRRVARMWQELVVGMDQTVESIVTSTSSIHAVSLPLKVFSSLAYSHSSWCVPGPSVSE